jgi:hypothetical protein
VPAPTELERDLQVLATELRRLEAEYNMYFGGRTPRPPHETRSRVDALVKRLDRVGFEQLAQRFRFQTLQSRYTTFCELWDRNLRSREEGRRGGPARPASPSAARGEQHRIVHDATIEDPRQQQDRIEKLYAALVDARREAGEADVPFPRFDHIVRDEVTRLRASGAEEITFRVAIRDGKVRLTARAKTIVEG